MTTDERQAAMLEIVDEIDTIFESVRGFPDKPDEPCADLCSNQWSDNFGCVFLKTRHLRSVLTALPAAQAVPATVNAVERSLVRQIVLSCTPGEGIQYRLRERMLAEIDKLPILD